MTNLIEREPSVREASKERPLLPEWEDAAVEEVAMEWDADSTAELEVLRRWQVIQLVAPAQDVAAALSEDTRLIEALRDIELRTLLAENRRTVDAALDGWGFDPLGQPGRW